MSEPRLPEGYSVGWEADLLVLRRPGGSEVAVFSDLGASPEEIARRLGGPARRSEASAGAESGPGRYVRKAAGPARSG